VTRNRRSHIWNDRGIGQRANRGHEKSQRIATGNDCRKRFSGTCRRKACYQVETGRYCDAAAFQIYWHGMDYRFWQCLSAELGRILREDKHVGTESPELGSEAALGVYLKIEEGGGDGGTCAESE
jgi:hypothetical protein